MYKPPTTPPMHQFAIVCAYGEEVTTYHEVEAAYLVEEGSYTLLKDRYHAVVAAFRTAHVVRIVRVEKEAE